MSNSDDTQASVSVLRLKLVLKREKDEGFHLVSSVERQAAANSKRHLAAEQESQEDNLSCNSLGSNIETC